MDLVQSDMDMADFMEGIPGMGEVSILIISDHLVDILTTTSEVSLISYHGLVLLK